MLIQDPGALTPSDSVEAMSRTGPEVLPFSAFEVYRNGVLDHVVNGPEGRVRSRMSVLYNLHPDDSWDYVPMRHRQAVTGD